jgi:hypothetical protein
MMVCPSHSQMSPSDDYIGSADALSSDSAVTVQRDENDV